MHAVAIECKGLNHESPEADSDHLYHQFIKNVHVSLQRTELHHPALRLSTALTRILARPHVRILAIEMGV